MEFVFYVLGYILLAAPFALVDWYLVKTSNLEAPGEKGILAWNILLTLIFYGVVAYIMPKVCIQYGGVLMFAMLVLSGLVWIIKCIINAVTKK